MGSIYLSVKDTNPGTFIGGTWERIKDRFLLAAGDTYSAGATGGEASHKLSVNEMPSHSHTERLGDGSDPQNVNNLKRKVSSGKENGSWIEVTWRSSGLKEDITTTSTGGSAAHNNMPPYLAVYMWVRTA